MQTPALMALREILFQGEQVSTKIPQELVDFIDLYESFLRRVSGYDLDAEKVAQIVALAVVNHKDVGAFEVGRKLVIPTRNEFVWFVKDAPWGCSVVRNFAGDQMIVLNSRMHVADEEVEVARPPVAPAKKDASKTAKTAV